jgi:hypothetical protein
MPVESAGVGSVGSVTSFRPNRNRIHSIIECRQCFESVAPASVSHSALLRTDWWTNCRTIAKYFDWSQVSLVQLGEPRSGPSQLSEYRVYLFNAAHNRHKTHAILHNLITMPIVQDGLGAIDKVTSISGFNGATDQALNWSFTVLYCHLATLRLRFGVSTSVKSVQLTEIPRPLDIGTREIVLSPTFIIISNVFQITGSKANII